MSVTLKILPNTEQSMVIVELEEKRVRREEGEKRTSLLEESVNDW